MEIKHLVEMANQIGEFFAVQPNRSEGKLGIAKHIQLFWVPRMRLQLLAHVADGGEGLHELVLEALREHARLLQPAQA